MKRIISHFFSILLVGLLFFQPCFGQREKIIVSAITADENNIPIPGVMISSDDGNSITYSNSRGEFLLEVSSAEVIVFESEEFYTSEYLMDYSSFFLISADASGVTDRTTYYSLVTWNHNNDSQINQEDQLNIGNSKPRLPYGLNISLKYKNQRFFALRTGHSV